MIRDSGGQILDIIEETEASPEVRGIRELNVGAYVVDSKAIFSVLERLSPSPRDMNDMSTTVSKRPSGTPPTRSASTCPKSMRRQGSWSAGFQPLGFI